MQASIAQWSRFMAIHLEFRVGLPNYNLFEN